MLIHKCGCDDPTAQPAPPVVVPSAHRRACNPPQRDVCSSTVQAKILHDSVERTGARFTPPHPLGFQGAQIRIFQLLHSLLDQFLEVELLGAPGGFCPARTRGQGSGRAPRARGASSPPGAGRGVTGISHACCVADAAVPLGAAHRPPSTETPFATAHPGSPPPAPGCAASRSAW